MSILTIRQVSKSFKNNLVLDNVSLEVNEGTIYGFLGKNGAGKTTLIKMILGLSKIDHGQIIVDGQEVSLNANKSSNIIGYLPDVPEYYDFMSAYEYLHLCAKISLMDRAIIDDEINNILTLVSLNDIDIKIGGYSRGMKQRLGIAQALLSKPKLLICDEPTSALDPQGRKEILDILKKAAQKTTIIFSTHILSDVERICDHVAILHNHKIILDTDIKTLKASYITPNIRLEFSDISQLEEATLIFSKYIVEITDDYLIIKCSHALMYNLIVENQIFPLNIKQESVSLEDVYLEVTNA